VHAGKNARMFSSETDYSPEEWRASGLAQPVYEDFTSKVRGPQAAKEKVLQIAKGRIWSGRVDDTRARRAGLRNLAASNQARRLKYGGGATGKSASYDPQLDLLYIGTGMPSPTTHVS